MPFPQKKCHLAPFVVGFSVFAPVRPHSPANGTETLSGRTPHCSMVRPALSRRPVHVFLFCRSASLIAASWWLAVSAFPPRTVGLCGKSPPQCCCRGGGKAHSPLPKAASLLGKYAPPVVFFCNPAVAHQGGGGVLLILFFLLSCCCKNKLGGGTSPSLPSSFQGQRLLPHQGGRKAAAGPTPGYIQWTGA